MIFNSYYRRESKGLTRTKKGGISMITKRIFGIYNTKEEAMRAKTHDYVEYFMRLNIEEEDGRFVLFAWM
jgi:hypothetical protein